MKADANDRLRCKLKELRSKLSGVLIDREEEIDLVLTALLAREHVLLVGPPGCGKSLLLDRLLGRIGGRKFSALLTRFSVPEEIFGPISLVGLKEDRFVRVTTGKLPEADLVFLDEVFRGSSAILNCLLKILNERVFDAGDGLRPTPLKLCVAASNEWPSPEVSKELAAVFDRFLLRKAVVPVRTRDGRRRLLWSPAPAPEDAVERLEAAELDQACRLASATPWSVEAQEAYETVLAELSKEGIRPGDRRQVKTVGIVRAFACLNGATQVLPEHLEIAACCLWDDPIEQPAVAARTIARIANPPGMRVNALLLEAEEVLADADPRDLAKAAAAAAKLGELDRRIGELGADPRALKVRTHVREQIRKLRLASLAAV